MHVPFVSSEQYKANKNRIEIGCFHPFFVMDLNQQIVFVSQQCAICLSKSRNKTSKPLCVALSIRYKEDFDLLPTPCYAIISDSWSTHWLYSLGARAVTKQNHRNFHDMNTCTVEVVSLRVVIELVIMLMAIHAEGGQRLCTNHSFVAMTSENKIQIENSCSVTNRAWFLSEKSCAKH